MNVLHRNLQKGYMGVSIDYRRTSSLSIWYFISTRRNFAAWEGIHSFMTQQNPSVAQQDLKAVIRWVKGQAYN
jgi:hypothetical protein